MSNKLLMKRFEGVAIKTVAPVISIWPKRKNDKRQKRVSKKRGERKVSTLFYTDPIFKAKKHDFL